MKLPDFPDLSPGVLAALLERHGLSEQALRRLPEVGIFNAIFAVGDSLILRVPRDHPAFVEAARKEARAVPAARAAGVRTPELVAFDDGLDLLPVPYSLYRRVPGVPLEHLQREPADTASAYRELGRDLAQLHGGVRPSPELAALHPEDLGDPHAWPAELAEGGWLGPLEARWLERWLDGLRERAAGTPPQAPVFRHGDLQATNVMVSPGGGYVALLDWGACGWGDAAHDFAGLPFGAVPSLLEGYREGRSLPTDGSFEARIVLRQLHLALFLLRRPPQPGRAWAERPLGLLLDLLRGLARAPDERWRSLLP